MILVNWWVHKYETVTKTLFDYPNVHSIVIVIYQKYAWLWYAVSLFNIPIRFCCFVICSCVRACVWDWVVLFVTLWPSYCMWPKVQSVLLIYLYLVLKEKAIIENRLTEGWLMSKSKYVNDDDAIGFVCVCERLCVCVFLYELTCIIFVCNVYQNNGFCCGGLPLLGPLRH